MGSLKDGIALLLPYRTSNNFEVGIVHEGMRSPEAMFQSETSIAHSNAVWSRVFSFFGGLGVLFILSIYGFWPTESTMSGFWSGFCVAVGVTFVVIAGVWASVYGFNDWGGRDSDLWTIVLGVLGIGMLAVPLTVGMDGGQKPKKVVHQD